MNRLLYRRSSRSRVDQLARSRRRQRDNVWICCEHGEPVRAARDAVVHLPLQQANDSRRQIRQRREAPISGQPLVVDENHERRHQCDEHEREQPCSHRWQNRGGPIEDVTRPAPDSRQLISVAGAHGREFVFGAAAGLSPSAKLPSIRRRLEPVTSGPSSRTSHVERLPSTIGTEHLVRAKVALVFQ